MTTLLLTGAGGFVGSHILNSTLMQTDWDIACLDSFRHNGVTDRIREVVRNREDVASQERVRVVTHDLRARVSSLTQMLEIHEPDYIVNAASLCQVDQSISDAPGFISNNVELVLTVLELAREVQPAHFLQVSTDEIYGTRLPHCPDDHNPSSPYAASKAAQEDICHAYATTFDVPLTIINSANIFGERQSLLAFVPRVLSSLLNDEVLRIHTSGGKPARRRYTYAPNVADFIVGHLRKQPTGREHLAGQEEMSVLALAEKIAELAGAHLNYTLVDGETDRPGFDKSYAALGGFWNPGISFTEGLERTVRWALANRDWIGA